MTAGAASAIAEITLHNVYETLTKIHSDSRTQPLLTASWTVSPDLKIWTFTLRRGVYGQKAYDLTLVSHAEPLDFGNFARPNHDLGCESAEFNTLWAQIRPPSSPNSATS